MISVEDSYEGAVRRLQRLGHAPTVPAPPTPFVAANASRDERMRELEELATLACEENERLEAELARLRDENNTLRRRVQMLDETIADPRRVLGLPELPARESSFASLELESVLSRPGAGFGTLVLFGLLTAAAGLVAVFVATTPTTDLRWAAQAFPPPRLVSALAAARAAVAPYVRVHPRYGRLDVDLDAVPAEAPAAAPATAPAPAPVAAAPAPKQTPPVAVAPRPAVTKAHKKPARAKKPHALPRPPHPTVSNDPLAGMAL